MTDEQYPFGGAIPTTHARNNWHGGGAEYGPQSVQPGGVGYDSYVQADQWGVAHGYSDPLYGAQPGDCGYEMPPIHGAHHPDTHLPQAFGGHATATIWETEATCHEAVLGMSSPVPPDAVGLTDASDRWGTAHPAATGWSETTDLPNGGHYTWNTPTGASTSAWEAAPHGEPGSLLDAPAHCGTVDAPAHQPPGPEYETALSGGNAESSAVYASQPEDSRTASEGTVVAVPAPRRSDRRNRRASARRSAFLTVAAPSVAVLGMAGFAGASVGLSDRAGDTAQADADTSPLIKTRVADNEFDTQLAGLPGDARDFADRASRAQERVDLEQRRLEQQKLRHEEAERKKAEAARREALRPKYALPVAQRGVGELFGAVGSMWSNRHTGLDFPVPMNTPVMAVTDGTVQAKWNQFYGNMVIVTAPDGTETWYCHLASARFRSGSVKAGEVIAYAGSSGNSSGPHLHLEVHPGGGDAVDPLSWLRSHGLDPT
ncbi:M23 family metallopeptidase [Streptomyces sp. WAC00263]|uniref:M23 family metallopeptidase n=1 Tax=Streptomyces sp. WAC00263 TaxID=1917422 RepID=UPI001F515017|nr:M23 family metallopeptidase [Streptomyces sp. WAC00263]